MVDRPCVINVDDYGSSALAATTLRNVLDQSNTEYWPLIGWYGPRDLNNGL